MSNNLFVWGAGNNGAYVCHNILPIIRADYDYIFFVDKKKSGLMCEQYKIISPTQLRLMTNDENDNNEIILAVEDWRGVKQECDKIFGIQIIGIVNSYFNFAFGLEKNVLSQYSKVEHTKRWECMDKNDEPIPWYTYSAIEYLNQFDFSKSSIFEYGCGYSSLYWSRCAKKIVSVENNIEWANRIIQMDKSNLSVKYKREDDMYGYVNSILEEAEFYDVIIIDGLYRDKCAENAVKKIAKNGIIILDNSDRANYDLEYMRAAECLKQLDFIQVDFHGIGPLNNYAWTTSMYISRAFDLKRKEGNIVGRPIGGLIEE